VESGGSVGKIKRNEKPLFRGESSGFVNLLLCQHVAKFTGTSRSIPPKRQGYGCRFRFHGTILHGNDMPVTTQEDDCGRDAHAMMGIRSPYDSILPHHIWGGKDSRYIVFIRTTRENFGASQVYALRTWSSEDIKAGIHATHAFSLQARASCNTTIWE